MDRVADVPRSPVGASVPHRRSALKVRLGFACVAALYVVLFLWSYRNVVTPDFAYLRYEFCVSHYGCLGLGLVFALLPTAWMPIEPQRPSVLAYYLLFLLVHVPVTLVPLCTLSIEPVSAMPFVLAAVTSFWLLGLSYRVPRARILRFPIDAEFFWALVILVVLACFALITRTFGFSLKIHSLFDVYEVRESFVDDLTEGGPLLAYVTIWVANVIGPFLFLFGLTKRSAALVAVGIFLQVLIFSITGFKSVLFSLSYLLGLFVVLRIRPSNLFRRLTLVGAAIIFIASVLDQMSGSVVWSSLFVRRFLLTPGLLAGFYHDFFSSNPKLLLSHSVLDVFFTYPYDRRIAYIIGDVYMGRPDSAANVNFIAEAFANFGYVGMLGFSLVLGAVLWIYDCLTSDMDYTFAALLLAVPVVSLANSALLTVLVTHGLGLVLVVAYVMPASRSVRRPPVCVGPRGHDGMRTSRSRWQSLNGEVVK